MILNPQIHNLPTHTNFAPMHSALVTSLAPHTRIECSHDLLPDPGIDDIRESIQTGDRAINLPACMVTDDNPIASGQNIYDQKALSSCRSD
jgi:hypothetical protein